MIERGVLEEVMTMKKLGISPLLPAMKAIGIAEFIAYLNGDKNFENALEMVKIQTRQYAKRQLTWFRNQFDEEWMLISG